MFRASQLREGVGEQLLENHQVALELPDLRFLPGGRRLAHSVGTCAVDRGQHVLHGRVLFGIAIASLRHRQIGRVAGALRFQPFCLAPELVEGIARLREIGHERQVVLVKEKG